MFTAGLTVQPEAEEMRTCGSCYVTKPLHQHSTTEAPSCKHTSSSPCRKKLPNNHCSNKAALIQLFRQRKGIHNLSIIGLFTVDQSTSIFKQLKCLWALGTAAQYVSLAFQPFLLPSSSSQTRRQHSRVGKRSLRQCRAGLVPPPQERRVTQAQPVIPHPTAFPTLEIGTLGFPALINHFSSVAHSEHSSCEVPALPNKSILNKAWAMRMLASNCVVSKPYCLVAIFYKLIRIFIGQSVHDKKRWVEVIEICFEYKPNPTLNHGILLFLLLHSPQACEDLLYPTISITAEFYISYILAEETSHFYLETGAMLHSTYY